MKKQYAVALHLLFWFYRFGWGAITWPLYKPENPFHLEDFFTPLDLSSYFLSVSAFYLNYLWIMPRFFQRKKKVQLVGGWLLMFVYYIGMRYFIEEYLFPKYLHFSNYNPGTPLIYYVVDNLYFAGTIIVPSIVLYIITHWMKVEKEKLTLKEVAGTAELNFLKSQVNPHFLYNTLNNIYSLVYHGSEKALPAIMRLSELMRYMTRESSVAVIALDKEIRYMESFIELESLRVAGETHVQLQVHGDTSAVVIAPLLLIPFVENGFKHGVINSAETPFTIDLFVDSRKTLQLHTRNRISQAQKDTSGGVGLQNVRRRLELIYPGRHQLDMRKEGEMYICELTIHL